MLRHSPNMWIAPNSKICASIDEAQSQVSERLMVKFKYKQESNTEKIAPLETEVKVLLALSSRNK
jgi:hypothetical protein